MTDTPASDTGLDPDQDDPAYLCGRLFAYLCDLDRVAAGDLDQHPDHGLFYRAFATTQLNPANTPTLLRHELPKLLRRARVRDRRAADRIHDLIGGVAGRLPADRISGDRTTLRYMFTLGYWHQFSVGSVDGTRRAGLLTPAQVAERYGLANDAVARNEIRRLGVAARGREPESGAKLYDSAELDRARAGKVGQGTRTDRLVTDPDG